MLAGLTSAYAQGAGTQSDPLISKSHIDNAFSQKINGDVDDLINRRLPAALFDEVYDTLLLRTSGYPGYTLTKSFEGGSGGAGQAVSMLTGGSFVLFSGSANVEILRGSVINVSTGNVVSNGAISKNQRYFCAENTEAVFSLQSQSSFQVDGYYKITVESIPPMDFYDVKAGDWFYSAVKFVFDNQYFLGVTETTFGPYVETTRGMFVTVLYRLAGKPSVSKASEFKDVANPNDYYYAPVVWASENGIVLGFEDGTFRADTEITREQMATFMYRYARYSGGSLATGSARFDSFPDRNKTSSYAVEALKWATHNEIINGSDGKLLPLDHALRAHVAQIIENYLV